MARETDTIFASAAKTDSGSPHSSGDFAPAGNWKGAIFFLDVTASSGTSETLDVKIQAKNPDGNYADVPGLAFAQAVGVTTALLNIYPGIGETANVSVSDILPDNFKAVATIAGTTPSFTFSLVVDYVD